MPMPYIIFPILFPCISMTAFEFHLDIWRIPAELRHAALWRGSSLTEIFEEKMLRQYTHNKKTETDDREAVYSTSYVILIFTFHARKPGVDQNVQQHL